MKFQNDKQQTVWHRWNEAKNLKYLAVSTGIGLMAAGVIYFTNRPEVKVEGPLATRADAVAVGAVESYPFERDTRTGKVMRDASNNEVPNPHYSKEDSFRGDGVCDTAKDKAQLKDPTGAPVPDFRSSYTNNVPITLPLENENSLDCVLERLNQCGPVDATHPILERPAFVLSEMTVAGEKIFANANARKRFRTQQEVEGLYEHPNLYQTEGGDLYTVVVDYRETCNDSLPLCTPLSFDACYCANLKECQPKASSCGKEAQCDPSSGKERGGCKEGSYCSKCKCVKAEVKPTCKDGFFNRAAEQCDESVDPKVYPRGGCSEGQYCENCQCVDTPKPVDIPSCVGQNAETLKSAIRRRIDGKSEDIRKPFANSPAARVEVKASASFNSLGKPVDELLDASVTCTGSQDQCKSPGDGKVSKNGTSSSGSATGILNFKLEGYQMIGAGRCKLEASRTVSSKE